MAIKTFSKAIMASEDVNAFNGSCKFYSLGELAEVSDGAFVVLGDLVADTTYNATGVDYNVYAATAPVAVTDEVVVIDYAGIQSGSIGGNQFTWGNKLYNLNIPAGEAARFRRLFKGDKFWLTAGCFATAPTVSEFAVLTANDVILTPAAVKPEAGFTVKVLVETEMTTVQLSNGKKYLCEVVKL